MGQLLTLGQILAESGADLRSEAACTLALLARRVPAKDIADGLTEAIAEAREIVAPSSTSEARSAA